MSENLNPEDGDHVNGKEITDMAREIRIAQRILLTDLWNEQQSHCAQIHAEWDDIWEQAVQTVLPSWTEASKKARSVLETVCRLYVQALRNTHTLTKDRLDVRKEAVIALTHELRSLMGTGGNRMGDPETTESDALVSDPNPNPFAYAMSLDEHVCTRGFTAVVAMEDPIAHVRLVDGDGRDVQFTPPCDIYATDQPANLLYSVTDFDNHGVREELLTAAFAEIHSTIHGTRGTSPPFLMTTVWQVGRDFGLPTGSWEYDTTAVVLPLLLAVQRALLTRIFVSSPPVHRTCFTTFMGLMTLQAPSTTFEPALYKSIIRSEVPPMLWVPIPACYTAFLVDIITEHLFGSGLAPIASRRTMRCAPAPPPTQVWSPWLQLYVSPPNTTEFLRGWPERVTVQLRQLDGLCTDGFRKQLIDFKHHLTKAV